jgi:transcriptional regulator with XRE-family HTH domain
MNLGNRIKKLRKRRGISQERLAKEVGSTGATVSEIESGKRAPRVKLLSALADYFGVSADYLLGRAVHQEDLSDDLRELFQLAFDAGYAADLKAFFRWLKAKRNKITQPPAEHKPDEELLALVPELSEDDVVALLTKYDGQILLRMAQLADEQKENFTREIAKTLYYLELEEKIKKAGEKTGPNTREE